MRLDDTDFLIIQALQANGRLSFSEIGRQVGLTQPAVSERVKRLEEHEIISGYTAQVNLKTLGLGIGAIINLNTTHDKIDQCLKLFSDIPNIMEVDRITGQDCFLIRVFVSEPEELEAIVDQIARYGPVRTSLILRSQPRTGIDISLFQNEKNDQAPRQPH